MTSDKHAETIEANAVAADFHALLHSKCGPAQNTDIEISALFRKLDASITAMIDQDKDRSKNIAHLNAQISIMTQQRDALLAAASETRFAADKMTSILGLAMDGLASTDVTSADQVSEDARKWQSLIACDHIEMLGRTLDLNHIGVWFCRSKPDQDGKKANARNTAVATLSRYAMAAYEQNCCDDDTVYGDQETAQDAKKWRGINASNRVRVMSYDEPGQAIVFEFWREHSSVHPCDTYPQDACRAKLNAFAKMPL